MPVFIRVSEGETADVADDLYLIDDPPLAEALGRLIARRLSGRPLAPSVPRPLRPVPSPTERKGDA